MNQQALCELADLAAAVPDGAKLAVPADGVAMAATRELMRRGSVLNYASLGRSKIPGQPTLSEIRHWALDVER